MEMPENKEKPAEQHGHAYTSVLSRSVRIAVPVGSLLVLLAFAFVLSLPPNTAPIPVQTTLIYIPIYVTIVIVLVLASMYLFKSIVDKDPTPDHQ
jgi:heme/copper-type cytochrome/quinol oxidase subunit 2